MSVVAAASGNPAIGELDQFRQSFRDEAAEILIGLESALLALHQAPSDDELIGQVFRALHTIKGSGSMFGFDRLAAFTHELESAFDEVRKGNALVSSELVDTALAALDQIRTMLVSERDPAGSSEILARIRRLTSGVDRTALRVAPSPATAEVSGEESEWRIHFSPGPEMLRNGSDPLLLIKELAGLGKLKAEASLEAIPPLAELDPERCYVTWEMNLTTSAGDDAIRDVFIFVQENCDLKIDPVAAPVSAPGADTARCPSDITASTLLEQRSLQPGRRAFDRPDTANSLRVPAARLDTLVDLVGELVTVQARLSELAAQRDDLEVSSVAEEVERLASALRESSMNMRMLPIRGTFERFRRLVHDLARDLDKKVELTIEGADTELDKTVIEQLNDPLMHLIRNSMDHGIEAPDQRISNGKPATAKIHLAARHVGASVLISVSDDGRGIDTRAVRQRAVERGLTTPDAALTDEQIYGFLFEPGFSTARQVTDLSGRGVGMDVVRRHVDTLRGSVDVVSHPSAGTTVTLRLPLTLAIIDGLLVTVEDASFVLPLANTVECLELTAAAEEAGGGKPMVHLRGDIVPYIRLREYFGMAAARPEIEQIMLVETEEGRFGLVVDRVIGNCQTVIKSLGRCFRDVQIVSGATILGNGTVALILDAQRLVQDAIRASTQHRRARSPTTGPDVSHSNSGAAPGAALAAKGCAV